MICALTQGITKPCRDSQGGLVTNYITELGNIASFTEASGVVTGITMNSGKQFWTYAVEKNTAFQTETGKINNEQGTNYVEQALTVVLNKQQASTRNEIVLLAQNDLVIIALDRNGKYRIYGLSSTLALSSGMRLQDGYTADSGTARADRNGYTLPFMAEEDKLAPEVSSSIIEALLSPA